MRLSLAFFAALLASPAAATQEYILPTLFDVTGVADDDVLNVRARPSVTGEIIGSLAPDAERIEVFAHDATGRWAQINVGERQGWASLRYLVYRTDVWEEDALPAGFRCLGTEPFWALDIAPGAVRYSAPDVPERRHAVVAVRSGNTFRSPRRAVVAESASGRLTLTAVPMACSDGMSGRAYGLDATLILEADGAVEIQSGCCSIAPRR